ncbi:unnamed protein product [Arabidopsis halleri]
MLLMLLESISFLDSSKHLLYFVITYKIVSMLLDFSVETYHV